MALSQIKIQGAAIIPMTGENEVIPNGDICIQDRQIIFVGTSGGGPAGWQPDQTIPAGGMVAMPGFINCHTHAAMTLFRGYADDLPLTEWLNERIWPLEERLTGEDVYWGTMLGILEMIKSGTTTFADMYFFMDQVAQAVEQTGIRASLCRGMLGVAPTAQLALEETEQFIARWHGAAGGLITTMVGPHAPYTCPPEYLQKVKAIAEKYKVGVHIHLAETRQEVDDLGKQYGKTPVEYLHDLGLLDLPVLAAHCVHLTQNDLEILRAKDVGVAHNPESNLKLASGIAPIPQMLAAGIKVGLGTDGAASNNNLDLLEEMRTAALLHKVNTGDPTTVPAYQALEMATVNGGQVLGLKDIGLLKPGCQADIILLNFEKPHWYPKHDLIAHLVYAAKSSDLDTVLIGGRVVMKNGKVLTIDENRVLAEAQRCADRLVGGKG